MKFCTKCGAPINDGEGFCTVCGTPVVEDAQPVAPENHAPVAQYPVQPVPQYMPQQPVYADPSDHTAEFTAKDISDNKIVAMCPYLLGTIGIVIALLAANNSPYAGFHVRQALKFTIANVLILIVSLLLVWTFIIPILGGIASLVLSVCEIICFFQVCSGKAKDAPIIGRLPFFK